MEIITRPIREDEVLTFRTRVAAGFGDDFDPTEAPEAWFVELFPLDRSVAAFDGETMIGTLGAFPFQITLPGGGTVAMAGTTAATVAPTHRRRGVLTAMMRDHLTDTLRRGEPLAGLWATESGIYGRFGYGEATERHEIGFDRGHVTVTGESGEVRLVEGDEAARVLPAVYDAVRSRTPGMLSRTPAWWKIRVLFDPEHDREGATAHRYVVHETDGAVDGYAIYRQKEDWADGFPNGTVQVGELMAVTATAHTGLWRFLTGIDLFPRIERQNTPVDDPLPWKVPDPRRIRRKRWDGLHVRVLDVVPVLEARSFGCDGTVRFAVDDEFLPGVGGSFELTVLDGIGRCRRVEPGGADLRMGVRELSGLVLGGGDVHSMAAAGLVLGGDDDRILLGRMLRGDVAPWCEEVF